MPRGNKYILHCAAAQAKRGRKTKNRTIKETVRLRRLACGLTLFNIADPQHVVAMNCHVAAEMLQVQFLVMYDDAGSEKHCL